MISVRLIPHLIFFVYSDEECASLNSDYDDSPTPKRKIYKNSLYNTQTDWKPTEKPDL